MSDLPAASDEGVGNQPAVAFVWQGFGAHDRGGFFAGGGHELAESCKELGGLHVVGVGIERFDPPGDVGRILQPGGSSAAQIDEVAILNSCCGERSSQRLLIELRMPSGAGKATDVGE